MDEFVEVMDQGNKGYITLDDFLGIYDAIDTISFLSYQRRRRIHPFGPCHKCMKKIATSPLYDGLITLTVVLNFISIF